MQQLGANPSALQKPATVKPGSLRSHRSDGQRVASFTAGVKIPVVREDVVNWSQRSMLVHEGLDVCAIGASVGPNLVQIVGLNEAVTEEEQKQRLEKGLTIDLLREHLPNFFREPGPMDIYSENILFVDDISPHIGLQPFETEGKENYASMLWNLRFHTSLFCRDVEVRLRLNCVVSRQCCEGSQCMVGVSVIPVLGSVIHIRFGALIMTMTSFYTCNICMPEPLADQHSHEQVCSLPIAKCVWISFTCT